MHILLTVNAAWNIRNFRWPILRALIARGDRVTVLAPADASVVEIEAAGARFIPLRMRPGALGPLDNFAVAGQIRRALVRERPDVVLSWTIKNNIFGAFSARLHKVPFIPNVSGLGTAFLSGRALRMFAEGLYRLAFAGLETVFFQNDEDRALFVSRGLVPAHAARLLPGSGIDLSAFAPQPLPDGPQVFLMIARLLHDKGVREFVQAARLVRSERPDVRFRLVGDLSPANRSAVPLETVERWRSEGVVELPGPVADVRPEIAAAQCVVLPSYREGAPRTLIEGAAMARPAIATDVPGCRAVVDDGRSGLLCEARDPRALAAACRAFLAMTPAKRAAMGRAGRAKMEAEFDERLVVATYLAAIDQAAGKPRDAPGFEPKG